MAPAAVGRLGARNAALALGKAEDAPMERLGEDRSSRIKDVKRCRRRCLLGLRNRAFLKLKRPSCDEISTHERLPRKL